MAELSSSEERLKVDVDGNGRSLILLYVVATSALLCQFCCCAFEVLYAWPENVVQSQIWMFWLHYQKHKMVLSWQMNWPLLMTFSLNSNTEETPPRSPRLTPATRALQSLLTCYGFLLAILLVPRRKSCNSPKGGQILAISQIWPYSKHQISQDIVRVG